MAVAAGVLGYVGLFLLLVGSMTLAARGVGRLVGVPGFRWFSAQRHAAEWWRLAAIRVAAAAAPWCLSAALFGAQYAFHGETAPRVGGYVTVMPGPAQDAGMVDGDRVVRIGDRPVSTWDELRAVVGQQTGPVEVEVERGGERRILNVTPRQGRIGVTAQSFNHALGAAEVLRRAVVTPGLVVKSTWQAFTARATLADDQSERGGPVRIMRAIGSSERSSILLFLASLCAYLWPMLVGVALFELATGAVFHATYPEAATNPRQRGFRLARLHQALLLAWAAYLAAIPLFVLNALGVPIALLLTVWVTPAVVSAFPLIAFAGSEVWPRPLVLICLLAAIVVPCVVFVLPLALLRSLQLALKAEGFRFGWLRSEPPAPREAAL
ncbi:MAG: peptidase [Polyangiaceae bacterium]|jgi:hypothetical protein|nr:peptidase [Polyangiaceae bacterium]